MVRSGTILVGLLALGPLHAQYGGPAVLTRGQSPTGMSPSQIDFRPYLSLDFGYDHGLNGVSINPNGAPVDVSSTALDVSGGVSGLHSWKHTTVGLDYRAAFRHYTGQSYYDGTDQTLLLGVTHMLSRHVVFSLHENAGMFSQSAGAPSLLQTVPFDPSTTFVPTNDFFDNRTIYVSTQADLTVQKSTRLSFSIGGDGFLTRRRSTALYGVSGGGARADVQYRASRDVTVGAGYTYTHYAFRGIFSGTDLHAAVGSISTRLSRTVEFGAIAGVAYYDLKITRTVAVDPVVAAIIGISSVREVSYSVNYSPNIAARISKTVPRGIFFVNGGHAITPGNGLFLTSTSTTIGAGYSYTGLKRWSINVSLYYARSQSQANFVGTYGNLSATASVSRQIMRGTHGVFNVSVRQYDSPDFRNYNRWSYGVHLGLGFTPGDIPIRLW
jgi:hypothetical protein